MKSFLELGEDEAGETLVTWVDPEKPQASGE